MMTKEYKLPNGKIIMFDYDAYGVGQVTLEAMDMMVELLCKSMWIPCSERLPSEKCEYLVTYHPCYWDDVEYERVIVGIDTFRGKTTWAKKKYQRVIAWMPLPMPYKEKTDE